MSAEHLPESEIEPGLEPGSPLYVGYTPFWPLVIALVGLVGWAGYQCYMSYAQGAELNADFAKVQPNLAAAQNARTRLYSLAQDLVQTGAKDQYAAQIAKEANIQLKSNPNPAPAGSH